PTEPRAVRPQLVLHLDARADRDLVPRQRVPRLAVRPRDEVRAPRHVRAVRVALRRDAVVVARRLAHAELAARGLHRREARGLALGRSDGERAGALVDGRAAAAALAGPDAAARAALVRL